MNNQSCDINNSVKNNRMDNITKYKINDKVFIIEPVFKESSKNTIGSILARLMLSDRNNY